MTDLTEQLYAGTLPTGHYYFNNGVETYIVLYKNINSKHLILQEPEGLTVISGVPSYEEWQRILRYAGKYECEYTSCVMDYENLKEENTKLKEQLKECKGLFNRSTVDGAEPSNGELIMILTKIEQALVEDK